MQAKITGLGAFVPERVVDNHYFETIVDTTDEWIVSRTGIHTRHYAGEHEYTSDLCMGAVKNLLDTTNVSLDGVDFIIVATVTPDQPMPSVASQLQNRLGLKQCGAIDIMAACAGFGYGIVMANGLITSGLYKKVLVFGAETLTRITDFTDRTSCVLFGDGAGVVMVEAAEKGNILCAVTGSQGDGGKDLYLTSEKAEIDGAPMQTDGKIHQNGRAVFKWAVNTISEQMPLLVQRAGLTLDDIDWFAPHSANMRIIEALCNQSGFPLDKTLESISVCGNTSTASIPLAIQRGIQAGKVKTGDKVMMFGFGGGLVYAGVVVEWY